MPRFTMLLGGLLASAGFDIMTASRMLSMEKISEPHQKVRNPEVKTEAKRIRKNAIRLRNHMKWSN